MLSAISRNLNLSSGESITYDSVGATLYSNEYDLAGMRKIYYYKFLTDNIPDVLNGIKQNAQYLSTIELGMINHIKNMGTRIMLSD